MQDTPSRTLVCIEGFAACVTSKQRELLFTPGNCDTAQIVELAVSQDRRQDSPVHRGSVEHRASSSQDPTRHAIPRRRLLRVKVAAAPVRRGSGCYDC